MSALDGLCSNNTKYLSQLRRNTTNISEKLFLKSFSLQYIYLYITLIAAVSTLTEQYINYTNGRVFNKLQLVPSLQYV